MSRKWFTRFGVVVLVAATAAAYGVPGVARAASGGALTASAPGITPKTITIGYITDETGVASSTFADGPGGAQARIAWQNAHGGVDGRRLVLVPVDDQSNPTQNKTAAEDLVEAHHVFGVIDFSAFTFEAAPYLSQQGVPVTGDGFDGPEWVQPQSRNMFSWGALVDEPINGTVYNYTNDAELLKAEGVTKLAGLAYAISNSSTASIRSIMTAAEQLGIKKCYENLSVPFGGVDFTADVLSMQKAGCNGVVGSFVDSSDLAMSSAVKRSGMKATQMYFTGYDSQIQNNAANRAAFAGDWVAVSFDPSSTGAANQTMFGALQKYDHGYVKGDIPDLGLYGSYLAADLMIQGLEAGGRNPSRVSFINGLHKVSSYTASGLLATSPISFNHFGTPSMIPVTSCGQFAAIKGTHFVDYDGGKNVCGKRIPINMNA